MRISFPKILSAVFAATLLLFAARVSSQVKSPVSRSFLFLSDIHLDTEKQGTEYHSDTGMELWQRFLRKADSVLGGPEAPRFIVYTGDLPAHYNPCCIMTEEQRQSHDKNLTAILTGLRTLADKHKKALFYLPGNNDGLAGDYSSFADAQQQTPFSLVPDKANPYPALNVLPGRSGAPCVVSNPHPSMGYYAARPEAGLRLICMNTIIFSPNYNPADGTSQLTDGNTQLQWLAAQLKEAANAGEKVYIAMHIPPGNDAWNTGTPMWAGNVNNSNTGWLGQFLTLTAKYQPIIAGILYGHTHMDELRRLYDPRNSNRITAVAISCPGVTPLHNNNPGFKTVTYHPATKALLDFTTYYTTPADTVWGNKKYSFRSSFPGKGNTIYQRIAGQGWSAATVATFMSAIYKVYNGSENPARIQTAVDVKLNSNW